MNPDTITQEQWQQMRNHHPAAWKMLEEFSAANERKRLEELADRRGLGLFKLMEACHA